MAEKCELKEKQNETESVSVNESVSETKVEKKVEEGEKGKIAGSAKSPFLVKKKDETASKEQDEEDINYFKKQQADLVKKVESSSLFVRRAKLYFLLPSTGKLETRGSGMLMIMGTKSGLHKIMMVRDNLMLKGADHYIAPSAKLIKAVSVPNSYVWVAVDDKSDAEVNYKRTTYFATFEKEKDAEEFRAFYEAGQENNRAVFDEIKTRINKE
ncbi:YRB1 [Enterospora canceri]|uniref:YRB1 n=1 Tax=Enterospora canceri TaxID=1081671 RepID=A0A1Y1S8S2_9MICR|nr:YRB1 [Enterospora canceri]